MDIISFRKLEFISSLSAKTDQNFGFGFGQFWPNNLVSASAKKWPKLWAKEFL